MASIAIYTVIDLVCIPPQKQRRIREDHKSLYSISTTYVYGQEKYLLVRAVHSEIIFSSALWITVA